MVLQNYQNFIEMTSNMIYIVAFGGGLKCLRKIHLKTQCPHPQSLVTAVITLVSITLFWSCNTFNALILRCITAE